MPVVEMEPRVNRAAHSTAEPAVPDFELGEDVSQQRHLKREKEWAATLQTEGREQFSARETMIKYRKSLRRAIDTYHFVVAELVDILIIRLDVGLVRLIADFLAHDAGKLVTLRYIMQNRNRTHLTELLQGSDTAFQVCVRARPLFKRELADGEYSTIFCQPLERQQISVHEGRLDRSGRRLEMTHHNLMFHKIWDDSVSDNEVCKQIVDPLVEFIREKEKSATIIMYGQTGTGKTYTMQGIFRRLATLLEGCQIAMNFIEIDGRKAFDLLANRKPVRLMADEHDKIHIKGAKKQHFVVSSSPVFCKPKHIDGSGRLEKEAQSSNKDSKVHHKSSHSKNTIKAPKHDNFDGSSASTISSASIQNQASHCEINNQMTEKQDLHHANTIDHETPLHKSSADSPDAGGSMRSPILVPSAQSHDQVERSTVKDFLSAARNALESRAQLVTERNPVSSRTHAVCQIFIQDKDASTRSKSAGLKGRKITLVDLAGSERKYETMHMSVAEHKRSADINYTLMTLRHVFRTFNAKKLAKISTDAEKSQLRAASHLPSHVEYTGPTEMTALNTKKMTKTRRRLRKKADRFVLASHFRGSLLTRILRPSFTGNPENHRTKVIATVSPAATDVYHTINTLSQVMLMSPFLEKMALQTCVEVLMSNTSKLTSLPVHKWGPEEVGIWLRTAEQGRFAEVALPPGITGAQLLELSKASLAELFGKEGRIARTVGEGQSWVITNEDGNRREHYSKGRRDLGGAMYKSLMKFSADFETKNFVRTEDNPTQTTIGKTSNSTNAMQGLLNSNQKRSDGSETNQGGGGGVIE